MADTFVAGEADDSDESEEGRGHHTGGRQAGGTRESFASAQVSDFFLSALGPASMPTPYPHQDARSSAQAHAAPDVVPPPAQPKVMPLSMLYHPSLCADLLPVKTHSRSTSRAHPSRSPCQARIASRSTLPTIHPTCTFVRRVANDSSQSI